MGIKLGLLDEGMHTPGDEINWNESRYIDFWDPTQRIGGWFRIGARPNANYAEMSACIFMPDGSTAFAFERAHIDNNSLTAGGQSWVIDEPWSKNSVTFSGEMSLFANAWALTNPKKAFTEASKVAVEVKLSCRTEGLESTMGQDQDQHHLIFLPGQADFHYQHLTHVTGTVSVGNNTFLVNGHGGKDHSWGPRNWHAKIYLRWLICGIDDDNGFMLTRAVGPTKQTRSGFVWLNRKFHVVDSFDMKNFYADAPNYECLRTEVSIFAGEHRLSATGTPQNYIPARHRQTNETGEEAILRIVKQPTDWALSDGRKGAGHLEYHDLVRDGIPVGLHD